MKEALSTHYFGPELDIPEPFEFLNEPKLKGCGVCGATKEWIELTGEVCGNPMLLDPPLDTTMTAPYSVTCRICSSVIVVAETCLTTANEAAYKHLDQVHAWEPVYRTMKEAQNDWAEKLTQTMDQQAQNVVGLMKENHPDMFR